MENRPPLPKGVYRPPLELGAELASNVEVLNRPPLPKGVSTRPALPEIPALDPSAMKVEVLNRPPLPKGVPPLKFGVEAAPKVVEPPKLE